MTQPQATCIQYGVNVAAWPLDPIIFGLVVPSPSVAQRDN